MTPPVASFFSDFGDAIDFLLHERESVSGETMIGGSEIIGLTLNHIALSGAAMLLAAVVAVPLGLYLGHYGKGEFAAINASNVGRAIPTLVLLAVFIAYLGVGFIPIMISLSLLALPPILTNTYVGTRQVDRDSVDAARGMGMSETQIMRRVELPLAVAIVFAGIRVAAVNVVATATIAPLAGVTTLGDPIINVNTYGDEGRLAAALVVALLAVVTEVVLGAVQRAVTPRGLKLEGGGRWRRLALPINRREATT
jgi:osmoprotectant transport system permease protein